jgi:hypothetical protein
MGQDEAGEPVAEAGMGWERAGLAVPEHAGAYDEIGSAIRDRSNEIGQTRRVVAEVGVEEGDDIGVLEGG